MAFNASLTYLSSGRVGDPASVGLNNRRSVATLPHCTACVSVAPRSECTAAISARPRQDGHFCKREFGADLLVALRWSVHPRRRSSGSRVCKKSRPTARCSSVGGSVISRVHLVLDMSVISLRWESRLQGQ